MPAARLAAEGNGMPLSDGRAGRNDLPDLSWPPFRDAANRRSIIVRYEPAMPDYAVHADPYAITEERELIRAELVRTAKQRLRAPTTLRLSRIAPPCGRRVKPCSVPAGGAAKAGSTTMRLFVTAAVLSIAAAAPSPAGTVITGEISTPKVSGKLGGTGAPSPGR